MQATAPFIEDRGLQWAIRAFLGHLGLQRAGPWWHVPVEPPPGWGSSVHAIAVPGSNRRPNVWLLNGGADDPRPEWVAEVVSRGVRTVAAETGSDTPYRAKRLIALPLVGTGEGGLRRRRGAVIEHLLPCLDSVARDEDVDIALVLADDRDLAAVTERRLPTTWHAVPAELIAAADRLGQLSANGGLSLFLGAGVSIALGLPGWMDLVDELAREARVKPSAKNPLDAAQELERALGPDRFQSFLMQRFSRRSHTLAHGLLATLGIPRVVTTNYDDAYELADEGASGNRDLRVLVREMPDPRTRWLLKIHGDVRAPGTFVLTRDQYSDLAHRGAPLRGMVQSLLMTSHLLFVGYSLVDRTFLLLADQVRAVLARATGPSREVATVLSIRRDEELAQRCRPDLRLVAMPVDKDDSLAGARLLEVFLDRVVWAAVTAGDHAVQHLLDERYAELIRPDADLELRRTLSGFLADVPPAVKRSQGWRHIRSALLQLGADAHDV